MYNKHDQYIQCRFLKLPATKGFLLCWLTLLTSSSVILFIFSSTSADGMLMPAQQKAGDVSVYSMTTKLSSLFLLLGLSICAVGQTQSNPDLFANGIYLEDLNVTIPWHIDFSNVKKYGNPTIDTITKRNFIVRWTSVKILNGININLRYLTFKNFATGHKYVKLTELDGAIDSTDVEKIKSYLVNYTKDKGSCHDGKNKSACYWKINGCNVRVGQYKGRHASQGSFFDLQKSLPKQKGR